jgi:integrase
MGTSSLPNPLVSLTLQLLGSISQSSWYGGCRQDRITRSDTQPMTQMITTKQAELNGQPVPRLHIRTITVDGTVVSRSWLFRVTIAGGTVVQRGLGSIDGLRGARVSLTAAVKQARVLDGELAQGKNPFVRQGKMMTFGQVVTAYAARQEERGNWGVDHNGVCSTAALWRKWLTSYLAPIAAVRFDDPRIDEILLSIVEPIWGTKTGDDVLGVARKAFKIAIAKPIWFGPNPCDAERMEDLFGKGRDTRSKAKGGDVKPHASLPFAEIPAFVATLSKCKGNGAAAALFCQLTTARSSNVIFASKSCIDRAARTWTVPGEGQRGEKMKSGIPHTYYLSDAAMAIVDAMWDLEGDLLFPGKKGAMNIGAIEDKVTDPAKKGGLGLRGRHTPHGMRTSFAHWVRAYHPTYEAFADAMLAHAEGEVKQAYFRNDATEVAEFLSQGWADFCFSRPASLSEPRKPRLELVVDNDQAAAA